MANGENDVSTKIQSKEKADHSLASLLRRADAGDETELRLFKMLMADPAGKCLVDLLGNVAHDAESALIQLFGGPVRQAAIEQNLRALREDLSGANPDPVERLLIERVVACWLQLAHADTLTTLKDQTRAVTELYQRRQDRAHRRFLSAVKMLTVVRRMALPIRVDVSVDANVTTTLPEGGKARRPRCCPPTTATDPVARRRAGELNLLR